jgi:hypothetical protein
MDVPAELDALWKTLGAPSADPEKTRIREADADVVLSSGPIVAGARDDLPQLVLSAPGVAVAGADLVPVGVLGEGGMGRVLLARQRSLGREVAVKLLLPGATPGSLMALLQEAKTIGALEHPGIVPLYALATEADGRPALVMKRIDGVTWARLMEDEAHPSWEVLAARGEDHLAVHLRVFTQVCNAIAFAHRKGVIHRDLKPANVLIGELGEVYVVDWGVAMKKPAAGEVRKRSIIGTPRYLAPEMATGDDTQMDERTDVFLLGATLYEMLARRAPWAGPDLQAVVSAAWECRPEPLPTSAPLELAGICKRAMERLPKDRFQTVLELRDAVTGYLQHRGSMELTRAAWERLDQLLAALRFAFRDRATIARLVTECRFGFTLALRDWPQNEQALEGQTLCLEAAARFEVAEGNAEAARALVGELEEVPRTLENSIASLEQEEVAAREREGRVRRLSQELDLSVSSRQRLKFYLAIAGTVALVLLVVRFVPPVRALYLSAGPYFLAAVMATVTLVYTAALAIGRRSLLATRVNRRLAALVEICAVGPLLHRLVAARTGAAATDVVLGDMVMTAAVLALAGFTIHSSLFAGSVFFVTGALAGLVWPDAATFFYSLAAVLTLVLLGIRGRTWRSELSIDKD